MYVKHYVSKAFMKKDDLDSSFIAGIFQLIAEIFYEIFWGFWHISSNTMMLDTAVISLKNWQFYRRHQMSHADRKKASLLTLRIYESLLDSGFYTIQSKEKQYYSFLFDKYYEVIQLPKVYVITYETMSLKNRQKIYIGFNGTQLKAIQSDDFLTALNQTLASTDNNLTAQTPLAQAGWLIYKIKDDAINYRIDLTNNFIDDLDSYSVYIDHSHVWDLKHQFSCLIAGNSGSGKTGMIIGILAQLLQKPQLEVFCGDGKQDELGALCNVILPKNHTFVGKDVAALVHTMYKEMKQRYAHMSNERKKRPRELAGADFTVFGYKMIVCIIDEQSVTLESLSKKEAAQYTSELLQLAQAARSAGIVLVIAMQQANAQNLGGTKGTAIRDQLSGCRILMGSERSISTQNKTMVFGSDTVLPPQKHTGVGTGYVQTSSMASPECFQAPLLPDNEKKLYDLLLNEANHTDM